MSETAATTATAETTTAASTTTTAAGSFLATESTAATSTNTAASGAPARFFSDSIAKDGVFNEGWTDNLKQMGLERLANKAMTAKDEATFFKTMDDTLGYVGKKSFGSYPKEGAADDEIAAYRESAGVPTDPAGYELKPGKLPEGVEWNDEHVGEVAALMHKHHIPKAAAQELLALHLQQTETQAKGIGDRFQAERSALVEKTTQEFRKEWGADYDQRHQSNVEFVKSRADLDLSDPTIQTALSHPGIVRLVDEARRALRETPLPGVTNAAVGMGSMSPGQQAFAIQQANPNWQRDPALSARINQLANLEAQQRARK